MIDTTEESKPRQEASDVFRIELPVAKPHESDFRNRLASFLDLAYLQLAYFGRTPDYSFLERVFGLEIVGEMDPTRHHYRCVQYVFGTVKHEPWVKEEAPWTQEFLDHALEFLRGEGYRLVGSHDDLK